MSLISQSTESAIPHPKPLTGIVRGNQSYTTVVIRLIGAELYKIRRRAMSKVLSIVTLVIMIVIFCIISIGSFFVLASPAATFLPPPCSSGTSAGIACTNQSPTQTELNRVKLNALTTISAPLRLPESLTIALQVISLVGVVLIAILTSTIVGNEYSVGTIRLMFTRGPTRTQFFLAKIATILICIILGVIVIVPIGILMGALLNLITGISVNFSFLTGSWFLHTVLKLFITMLGLFVYAMIALCLSILGRSTVAGLASALIWWGLETILTFLLLVISNITTGALADFARAIPNYFIENSIGSLLQNQSHYISASEATGAVPDWQALIVLLVYLVVFIGIAWWVNQKRDITN